MLQNDNYLVRFLIKAQNPLLLAEEALNDTLSLKHDFAYLVHNSISACSVLSLSNRLDIIFKICDRLLHPFGESYPPF